MVSFLNKGRHGLSLKLWNLSFTRGQRLLSYKVFIINLIKLRSSLTVKLEKDLTVTVRDDLILIWYCCYVCYLEIFGTVGVGFHAVLNVLSILIVEKKKMNDFLNKDSVLVASFVNSSPHITPPAHWTSDKPVGIVISNCRVE